MTDKYVHFLYTRWAKQFACGVDRKSVPVGASHVTYNVQRITCPRCQRVVGA